MLIKNMSAAKKLAPRSERSHCLWTPANKTKGIGNKKRAIKGKSSLKRIAATNTEQT
jgi:hypothetical protein